MLIANWRQSWRLWSLRVPALGTALYTGLLLFPAQASAVWAALPADLQEAVPGKDKIAIALLVATAVARVIKQEGSHG